MVAIQIIVPINNIDAMEIVQFARKLPHPPRKGAGPVSCIGDRMIPFFPMIIVHPPAPGRGPEHRYALEVAESEGMVDHKDPDLLGLEDEWWRQHHHEHPWARIAGYSDFASAYHAGAEGYLLYGVDGMRFLEAEQQLRRDYENTEFWLRWDEVRAACHAAWTRMEFHYNSPHHL